MSYHKRLLRSRRQQRLGKLVIVTSVFVSVILAGVIKSWLPIVPGTIGFFVVAISLAMKIQRWLGRLFGFQARKASLQHLKSDCEDSARFLRTLSTSSSLGCTSDSPVSY